jgi:hypothetical protein
MLHVFVTYLYNYTYFGYHFYTCKAEVSTVYYDTILFNTSISWSKQSSLNLFLFMVRYLYFEQITVAARSTAWVCGRSLAGIAGSNPARGMDV